MDNEKHIMINPEDLGVVAQKGQIEPMASADPFDDIDLEEEPSTPWADLSRKEKAFRVGSAVGRSVALITLLYFFVCSLDLLSKGFRLVGGRTAGEIFQQSEILQNPVVGVMIGILTTVLVQSSSTSTSIIVGMVAAGFMDVKLAIPLIMGSNIGTSITNTIVSFMQAGDKEQFRRAFAGATILDIFNWITVIVLLIVEVLTGYLYRVSKAIVDGLVPDPEAMGEVKLLSALTEPFVNLIVQLDESVLDCWSNPNCTDRINDSLIKQKCSTTTATFDVSERIFDAQGKLVSSSRDLSVHSTDRPCSNEFIFAGTSMSDAIVGVIVLVGSLIVLCTCLILIVKVLSSVLRGHVSVVIKKILNANIPYVPWITGYIAIFLGAVMTFLVQSSSVFTSALTPLVGLGVISLKRVYPLTLGANVGTTTTAVLASFAVEPKSFAPSMQIALCHLLFNVTGIILFYPIPYFRFPIQMAKFLGNCTAEYRWFAIFYMVSMFAIVPAIFIGLSFAGPIYVIILVSVIGVMLAIIGVMKVLQKKCPQILPPVLRDWKWLPLPLRSLKPYDDLFSKLACCAKCRPSTADDELTEVEGNSSGLIRGVENGKNHLVYYPDSTETELNKRNSKTSTGANNLNSNNIINNSNKDAGEEIANYGNNDRHEGNSQSGNGYGHNNYKVGGTPDINGEIGSDNEGYRGSADSLNNI
ncbi:sodium-dependent phosphate transport protein 2A isoform X2 [Folsomia candida]|nr:sodium-dependent phosphate transport protein 2A isoform X2 [Folsomia candida]XP_035715125.1 sodium-dependent phosphate transport protein 2A isoform X2 [Folsomia candida]